jgi:Major Facilitator Superfamily.
MEQLSLIMIAKGLRTFVFGMVSVMTPIYLAILGYSPVLVGSALFVIVSGNVFSNVLLTWYGNVFKRKNFLLVFSALMSISGFLLFFSSNFLLIFPALFIGNISTTGTEAGPFQSIETGVLPSLAGQAKSNRSFGTYNLIGYAMSSIGALASSFPSYFKLSPFAFRSVYLALCPCWPGFISYILQFKEHRGHNQEEGTSTFEGNGKKGRNEAVVPFLP